MQYAHGVSRGRAVIGLGFGLALILAAIFATGLARANEVFLLSARRGRCLLVRGGLVPGLQGELCAVLAAARAHGVSVRGVRRGGATELLVRGADPALTQRLRNAFSAHGGTRAPLLQPKAGNRNLGQRLGIVWLSWWLAR